MPTREPIRIQPEPTGDLSRRRFLENLAATATSASLLGASMSLAAESSAAPPEPRERKIKLGWLGCGGRGAWLAGLFKNHGGFEIQAVADYFPEYAQGATRNIADFYRSIVAGQCDNPTVQRAVDGTLTAILGREAALRQTRLTMAELIKENKRLPVDLSGLKA